MPAPAAEAAEGAVVMLSIESIRPNPRQPRQHFDDQPLQALANSIGTSGVMQPIIVRRMSAARLVESLPREGAVRAAGTAFELVAGERRWRAAQIVGLKTIPAIVRDLDDQTAAEFSLVENLQREDLNPIERADAFARLIEEFGLTHAQIAERVGIDRSSVTNHLRLIDLDDATKDALQRGKLSLGHAKVLLAITNDPAFRAHVARQVIAKGWSVRELENEIKIALADGGPRTGAETRKSKAETPVSASVAQLQRDLSDLLGTKVRLQSGAAKGTGKMIIEFYSFEQFEGLLQRLGLPMEDSKQ